MVLPGDKWNLPAHKQFEPVVNDRKARGGNWWHVTDIFLMALKEPIVKYQLAGRAQGLQVGIRCPSQSSVTVRDG